MDIVPIIRIAVPFDPILLAVFLGEGHGGVFVYWDDKGPSVQYLIPVVAAFA